MPPVPRAERATHHRVVTVPSPRLLLDTLYRDTLAALQPEHAVHRALETTADRLDAQTPIHLIGLGKAASAMCRATLSWYASHGVPIAGGLCVTHVTPDTPLEPVTVIIGDHPTPGTRSVAAAAMLNAYITARVNAGDRVIVLLSGGTSALIGAPRGEMSLAEYAATTDALLRSGLSINQINRQRRQLSRWGGGRLGDALQARGATVEVLAISDVLGGDLASIGSGPCIPDQVEPETAIPHQVISDNRAARGAAVSLARANGMTATAIDEPLHRDVTLCAERIVLALLTHASHARSGRASHAPMLFCWGGEPTVTLTGSDVPPGGRMQALALHIAQRLHAAGDDARGITVLAAGTDGRDGTTDAAGAIVDAQTWAALRAIGRTPERDLATFRSHEALAALQALIPSFPSDTNVNDLVLALVQRDETHGRS